jgi:hypothetical protein
MSELGKVMESVVSEFDQASLWRNDVTWAGVAEPDEGQTHLKRKGNAFHR